jgi:hypothetical protein
MRVWLEVRRESAIYHLMFLKLVSCERGIANPCNGFLWLCYFTVELNLPSLSPMLNVSY